MVNEELSREQLPSLCYYLFCLPPVTSNEPKLPAKYDSNKRCPNRECNAVGTLVPRSNQVRSGDEGGRAEMVCTSCGKVFIGYI
jgi:hypothetical protein